MRVSCARCKAVLDSNREDHICHDHVRHPGMSAFLDSMLVLEAVKQHRISAETALDTAVAVSFTFANLPKSEKVVANKILEHAGVDPVCHEY